MNPFLHLLMAACTNFLIPALIFFNIFSISQSTNSFIYHGFKDTNITTRLAAAVESNGALRLTTTSRNNIGHAFHPDLISLNSDNTSFSTNFVFQILPAKSRSRGGFGLAFTLSPAPDFPGAAPDHFLGVFNGGNDGDPSNHVFMVEFDTVNGYNATADSDGNHVGVNINGLNSTNAVASIPAARYVDGSEENREEVYLEREVIRAWIDYDGLNKVVNVTVAPVNIIKPKKPLISVQKLDLSKFLVKNVYAGFSAATGDDQTSSHYILGWSFRLNGRSDQLNSSLLPVVQDVRTKSSNTKLKTALIAAFSVLLFILVASLIGVVLYQRVKNYEKLEEWELDCPRRFRYRDLFKATKGFKESEKIGEGGFGEVYRGVLPSTGAEVAVKRIVSNNPLRGMREFAAEIESLGRLRHKNLVNLQGWCKYKNNLVLIYEYVPNGSLDSLLYNSNSVLTWEQRFMIIKGVASGLLYLHEEWGQVVIHRDIKSSNVLIDRDLSPKLGDFGLARLYDHGQNSHTTNVVGTIGYIAPELTRTGKASTSSDVFAYGILLLEIACGRAPVVQESHQNVILVDWVAECMQMGNIFYAVDARMNSDYVVEEMELVLGLGLLCSHPKAESRPTMREVMKYLNGDEKLPWFERLSSAGSRRIDEITARLLALGLSDSVTFSTKSYHSNSVGPFSSTSLDSGR